MRILALESSTTSAKAMLYDTETGKAIIETEVYGKMYENEILQNPVTVFEKTIHAGRKVLNGKQVDLVALGGTWHSIGLFQRSRRDGVEAEETLDKTIVPVTPIYHWSHTGSSDICAELRKDEAYTRSYHQRTGCMVNAIYPFFDLLLLRKKGYELSDYYIMGQGTYNLLRLTGRYAVTRCTTSGSGLLNIIEKEYDKKVMEELGITERNLPELIDSRVMYVLSSEGAELLGQLPGITVTVPNADGAMNQIGAGALKKGIMTFSVGTSGALRFSVPKPNIGKGTWCYLTPETYLSGAAVSGCCNCIDWFRDKVAGGISYSELETAEGAELDTPVFLPFLFGERCPGWQDERMGGFCELKPCHDRKAMYRAVQEGILFHMYHCYQILTELNGEPERIKVSGGIVSSEIWLQMCADIFGKTIEVSKVQQESLMGVVVWAMDCIGILSAKEYEAPVSRVVLPDQKNAKYYQEKFIRYLKCYYSSGI